MKHHFEETLLYVENLSVVLDDKLILKDINFTEKDVVRDNIKSTGQIISIIGRSGRGKSTLFKALTGLVPTNAGKIMVQ